ncbi:hypothetical protein KY084_13590 [Stakelama sp. CBK3Z-3]|uniref:Uncharacterized protein n=1 Tax=Stakelama flava TaxID=2860338 RepID=A0ABS6XNU6_9SPHN|nr:hypothetical protein [Stakelama flava]MBW4331900.1 hypothetical protein [Stakelama flava]
MSAFQRKMLITATAGMVLAMPVGMVLGSYTTSHMRRDFAYGYDMPDPDAGTAPFQSAEYQSPRPKRFGQDATFHAVVNGDEAADFDSVYFPEDDTDAD